MKPTLSLLLLSVSLWAMPVKKPVPGGLVLVPLPEGVEVQSVSFLDHRGLLFSESGRGYALAPVPLATPPGRYTFNFLHGDDIVAKTSVTIEPFHYEEQHLRIKERRKVEPNSEDLKRIRAETPRKKRAKSYRSGRVPDLDLLWPAEGAVSSPFGLRRFFNGLPRAPHRGIDIAAPAGAAVRAAADGLVVDAGEFFFSGNLIFLEHGAGLMTLYAHLSRIVAEPGKEVRKGEVIGYVGSTGRVTGPHLHFSTLIDGVYVDPTLFLPDDGQAKSGE